MAAPGQTPKSDSGVAELQRVLAAYAQATGYTAANPGPIDGIVGTQTALAVIAMLPKIPNLPDAVRSMATVMPMMLATDDGKQAMFNLIRNNASGIAKAIVAMEVVRVTTGSGTPGTPTTSTGGKAAWAVVSNAAAMPGGALWLPVLTPGGSPAAALAIWYFDGFHLPFMKGANVFRVAVPRGSALAGGYENYVEIAPSASQPAYGTPVSRTTFFTATGQWWKTPFGMAAIGVGAAGAGFAAYKGARWVLG
jgi:hypothetical protein